MHIDIPYRENTLRLMIGDAVLYYNQFTLREPITWLSWGVRQFTGEVPLLVPCPVNHTAVVSVDEGGEWVLIEALGRGLVSRPLKEVLDRDRSAIVVRRPRERFDAEAYVLALRAKVGTGYDFWNLVVDQPLYRVTKWVFGRGWWWGDTGHSQARRFQCAEAWAWALGRERSWLYSSAEILEDPGCTTEYWESR